MNKHTTANLQLSLGRPSMRYLEVDVEKDVRHRCHKRRHV